MGRDSFRAQVSGLSQVEGGTGCLLQLFIGRVLIHVPGRYVHVVPLLKKINLRVANHYITILSELSPFFLQDNAYVLSYG
jgi:hypothetical protein